MAAMEMSDQPAGGAGFEGLEKLRLKVASGNAAGTVIEVEDELMIGRQAAGVGSLADDMEISRRHARIVSDGEGRYSIEDLGSTNGTYVNGRAIEGPVTLEPGDRIEVGGSALIVQVRSVTPRGTPVTTSSAEAGTAEDAPPEAAAPAAGGEPVLSQTSVPGLPPLDLRFEFDVEGQAVTIRIGDGGGEVKVLHAEGVWRLAI